MLSPTGCGQAVRPADEETNALAFISLIVELAGLEGAFRAWWERRAQNAECDLYNCGGRASAATREARVFPGTMHDNPK